MKAIWVCPALCGCQIEMDAEFFSDGLEISNGLTYSHRHPKAFTATSLNIISICPTHQGLENEAVDESYFIDFNERTMQFQQNRGYLKLPLVNPSAAEILYMNLYRYTGQMTIFPCGCSIYKSCERNVPNSKAIKRHPLHSKKCERHKNDTDDGKAAKEEFKNKEVVD